ncbi:Phosphoglycolate phosphatase 1B, chloroplastic [Linum grandiflorum]
MLARTAVSVASTSTTTAAVCFHPFLNHPHKRRLSFLPPTPSTKWYANPDHHNVTTIFSKKHQSRPTFMDSFKTRASSSAPQLDNADALIDSVETFIFDCDGVIWKGDKLIEGVPETLDMLRSRGKRLVFVTNNSTKSRKQYGKKFETLGLNVTEVYVIGEEGILKELELAGIQYLGGPGDGDKKIELKPGYLLEHDKDVGAVVVGFDRYFNYYKVQYGTLCIRENPGCLFIATNRDAVTHLTDAQEWAGGGSMVGAVLGSTKKEPLVVGKPSTFMMDYLANEFGILKSQICMVGDRLDTDILFGQNGGCKTLLVLSGVTSLSMLQSPSNTIQPDFYTSKISDFLSLKAAPV